MTFEQLPKELSELTNQVMKLRDMVAALKSAVPDEKHRIVGIDEAYIITHKAKPTIYTLTRKGIMHIKVARNSTSMKMNC